MLSGCISFIVGFWKPATLRSLDLWLSFFFHAQPYFKDVWWLLFLKFKLEQNRAWLLKSPINHNNLSPFSCRKYFWLWLLTGEPWRALLEWLMFTFPLDSFCQSTLQGIMKRSNVCASLRSMEHYCKWSIKLTSWYEAGVWSEVFQLFFGRWATGEHVGIQVWQLQQDLPELVGKHPVKR